MAFLPKYHMNSPAPLRAACPANLIIRNKAYFTKSIKSSFYASHRPIHKCYWNLISCIIMLLKFGFRSFCLTQFIFCLNDVYKPPVRWLSLINFRENHLKFCVHHYTVHPLYRRSSFVFRRSLAGISTVEPITRNDVLRGFPQYRQ
jgi:hypothetical protein